MLGGNEAGTDPLVPRDPAVVLLRRRRLQEQAEVCENLGVFEYVKTKRTNEIVSPLRWFMFVPLLNFINRTRVLCSVDTHLGVHRLG